MTRDKPVLLWLVIMNLKIVMGTEIS